MIHSYSPIEFLVHFHMSSGVGPPALRGQHLQPVMSKAYRVIHSHRPLVLEANHSVEIAFQGSVCSALCLCIHSEAFVVLYEKLWEHPVGCFKTADSLQPQLGAQSVLQSPEQPLDSTFGLWTPCLDALYSEFRQ